MNVPTIKKKVRYGFARRVGAVLEFVHWLFPKLGEPKMTRFVACQFAHSHWFSHKNAEKDFGYKPVVGPEEGLKMLVQSLKSVKTNKNT